jgi:site-specific DNA-methyltransferase (adenine-specific)
MENWINKVIQGDCIEVMKDIPDKSIDAIISDPPYGTTACRWDTIIPFEPLWEQYKRIIKDNGAIVLTASQPFTSALVMSNVKMFKYEWVWIKPQGVDPFMSKIRPLNNIEYVLVFGKKINYFPQKEVGKPYHIIRDKTPRIKETNNAVMKQTETKNEGDRLPIRTLYFKQEKGLHPTQKPVALFEYLIKTYTSVGDTVLDNTIGSGTTAVAAINTGRNFIGIEMDKGYCDIANKRIQEAREKLASKLPL